MPVFFKKYVIKLKRNRRSSIKITKRKRRKKTFGNSLDNEFLGFHTKNRGTKTRIDKCDYTKPQSFCTAKETLDRIKRQPIELKDISADHISNKGFISNMCKKLIWIQSKNPTAQLKIKDINGKTHKWPTGTWEDARHH